jgi:hypothetical protein
MARTSEKDALRAQIRNQLGGKIKRSGFLVAPNLPIRRWQRLRPSREIAVRLMALDAVYTWVAYPEGEVAGRRIRAYDQRNELRKWMTQVERRIFSLPRKEAIDRHQGTIGWRLENMWPLAWALGFSAFPSLEGRMISRAITGKLLMRFLPGLGATVDDLLARARPRLEPEVMAAEDLFYCLHNAVRSAQVGGQTVPAGFDPVSNGGVIHERRHALTWCLSSGIGWDDVDLST